MGAISGENGFVKQGSNLPTNVTGWTFDTEYYTARFGSSSSGGYKQTIPGVQSGTGTFDTKFDIALAMPIATGTLVTLLLYLDATHFYSVPAVIKDRKIKCDQDNGEPIGASYDFETSGAWTEPTLP